jgi:Ribosomal protein S13/S18
VQTSSKPAAIAQLTYRAAATKQALCQLQLLVALQCMTAVAAAGMAACLMLFFRPLRACDSRQPQVLRARLDVAVHLRLPCIASLWPACYRATNLLLCLPAQSLIAGEEFQHILRVLNTNVDGKQKVMYAMTSIRGIGRRFANLVCKKAEVDMSKR